MRLRGEGRRSPHRRRVHRPPHAGPALVATACTRRSRPRKACKHREREPDAGHHHVPELLPHVLEALRHDGHRRHRGRGVRQNLQPRRPVVPDQPARWSARTIEDVVYKTEREKFEAVGRRRSRSCTRRGQPVLVGTVSHRQERAWSRTFLKKTGGARTHVLNAKQHEREADIVAAGRPPGRGHHLHQHGRPRHRHRPRRKPRGAGQGRGRPHARATTAGGGRDTGSGRGAPGRHRGLGEALRGGPGQVQGDDGP